MAHICFSAVGMLALEIPDRSGSTMDAEMFTSWLDSAVHAGTVRGRRVEEELCGEYQNITDYES